MGGHGHGYGPNAQIPSPDKYKVEDVPELMKIQERLAAKGLKDPWLRNEAWRFDPSFGTPRSRVLGLIFRGWKYAVPAFILTIALEKYFGIDYHHLGHDFENPYPRWDEGTGKH